MQVAASSISPYTKFGESGRKQEELDLGNVLLHIHKVSRMFFFLKLSKEAMEVFEAHYDNILLLVKDVQYIQNRAHSSSMHASFTPHFLKCCANSMADKRWILINWDCLHIQRTNNYYDVTNDTQCNDHEYRHIFTISMCIYFTFLCTSPATLTPSALSAALHD